MLKKILITTAITLALIYGAFQGTKIWIKSLLPEKAHFQAFKQTQSQDLPYLTEDIPSNRGKILAVVTSVATMGEDKETGYEHTELARAYWVFTANGFDVDIASPAGGKPPVVLDGDDMGAYDYAFLNNPDIQEMLTKTIPLSDIDPTHYEAVYFVGGKGAMFDFPDNVDIQRITKALHQNDKVISAVCHGPAALVNVTLDDGRPLIADRKVSGFTNEEELLLIPDAQEIFPFLLQDKLVAQGAQFLAGDIYLNQVVQDGNLITGQNPWSVWTLSEMVISQLGYEPKQRIKTPEEFSVELLQSYNDFGVAEAKSQLSAKPHSYQQILILMHSIMAFMQFEVGKGVDLLGLAMELSTLKKNMS